MRRTDHARRARSVGKMRSTASSARHVSAPTIRPRENCGARMLGTTEMTQETRLLRIADASGETDAPRGDFALPDTLQLESLILNLDAALRVHTRPHFFSWTQGVLQSLVRHE